jgi:uncharacterized protein (UPF0264 family)
MGNNQRLLISVYDAQEAREALTGGARVIDCEDPGGALGDISPQKVMDVTDAVLAYKRDLSIQISTNIGENQLLFKRDDKGRAVQRFPGEIAGKAAQAALGVAAAMGTEIHPVSIVKVGLDGMPKEIARATLREVVDTLNRSSYFSRAQVIAVFFAQDLAEWNKRHRVPAVVRDLLLAREYVVDAQGDIDVAAHFTDTAILQAFQEKLRDDLTLYDEAGTLRPGVKISISELHSRAPLDFSDDPIQYLKETADLTAEAGADGVMIDTRIHSKVAKLCCLEVPSSKALADADSGLELKGIYRLNQIADFARYCHYRGIEFWASGSIQPFHAQPLWELRDGKATGLVDGMAVRGGASSAPRPFQLESGTSARGPQKPGVVNRGSKRVYRDLVAPYVPPAE